MVFNAMCASPKLALLVSSVLYCCIMSESSDDLVVDLVGLKFVLYSVIDG